MSTTPQPRESGYTQASTPYDSSIDTRAHIERVQTLIQSAISNLARRATVHDLSKLSSPEKEMFDGATIKLRAIAYGTPEYREALKELGPALQHHYEHNTHHPEHFANGVDGMTLLDVLEMLLDWKAATERMKGGGDIWKSIEHNTTRFNLSPQLASILRNTATELEWPKSTGGTP